MNKNAYQKGSSITFPLEFAEEEDFSLGKEYLYPTEVMEIQELVENCCDRMEYDGSMMYDEYPDKRAVERLAGQICLDNRCRRKKGIDERWLRALIQVLLSNEMSFRRKRRQHHKEHMRPGQGRPDLPPLPPQKRPPHKR